MVTLNIEYRINPGKEQEFRVLMGELAEASRQDEGCIRYQYYFHPQDPGIVMLWEQWEDAEVLAKHGRQAHFSRIVPRMREISSQEKFRFDSVQ